MALSRNTIIAIAAAVIVVAGGAGAWFLLKSPSEDATETAAAPANNGPLPDPVIVVISMDAVTQASALGQSVIGQMQTMANKAKEDLSGEGKALQAEEAAIAKLPADQRAARLEALAPRRAAFQQKASQREAQLKAAFGQARADLGKAIEPVLRQIVTARGANLVMDRRAASMLTDPSLDITKDVVEALNAKAQTYDFKTPPQPVAQ